MANEEEKQYNDTEGAEEAPETLGINVSEGVGTKDKVG